VLTSAPPAECKTPWEFDSSGTVMLCLVDDVPYLCFVFFVVVVSLCGECVADSVSGSTC
jgi:hypothetical protein